MEAVFAAEAVVTTSEAGRALCHRILASAGLRHADVGALVRHWDRLIRLRATGRSARVSCYSRVVLDRVGALRNLRDMRWIVEEGSRRDGTGHTV
jgi:hypothetical protein